MADKKKRIALVSPKGTYVFPKLNEPDHGTKEYPKPDGEYSVKLRLRADDAATKAFLAKLEPLHKRAVELAEAEFKKLKPETRKKLGEVKVNALFTECLDKETEEPTGDIEFKFACAAGGTYKTGPKEGKKWSRSVTIFDAKGTPMKNAPAIWGGTVGKVAFSVDEDGYFIKGTGAAGLKLALDAVQIIDLKSGGARDAAGYGFGAEDGYTHEDAPAGPFNGDDETTSTEGAAADAEADNEDF